MNLDINGILDSVTGSNMIGGITDMISSNKANKALQKAIGQAEGQINTGYDKAQEYFRPYYDQGTQFYKTLGDMINSGAFNVNAGNFTYKNSSLPESFTYQEYSGDQPFQFQKDPGYDFRMQEGQNAIESSAAARGGQLSGATLKALAKYGQDYASNEYQNAYGRYVDQRNYGRQNYNSDRGFALGAYNLNKQNYNNDRNFAYGVFSDDYNRRRTNAIDSYTRYNNMANSGYQAGQSLGQLATQRADNLANLKLQRGNANAAKAQSYGNSVGSMFSTSSGNGGGGVSFDLNSLLNNNNNTNGNKAQSGVDYNYGNVQNSNTQVANNSNDSGLISAILALI